MRTSVRRRLIAEPFSPHTCTWGSRVRQLTAFVACAFGRTDIENLYDYAIKRVLRQSDISPLRVDRLEHNDDIDDKILELIAACDFCIADLTYARPSVYYEAGRAHGLGKPVIFTARSDHFRPSNNDDFGNLRIHFDLQMKNIIKWSKSVDTFRARLASRIRTVTRPLRKRLAVQQAEAQARQRFAKVSQATNRADILNAVQEMLVQRRFKTETGTELLDGEKCVQGVTRSHGRPIFVLVLAGTTFTKRQLKVLQYWPSLTWVRNEGQPPLRDLVSHVMCCALRAVPPGRIADALPSFYRRDGVKVYSRGKEVTSASEVHLHILDSIESLPDLQSRLTSHVDWILGGGGNGCHGMQSHVQKDARG